MGNIDIDEIIKEIKKQALLHKSVDIEEYKKNIKLYNDTEKINICTSPSYVFRVGKKIDQKLNDNFIYKKIRPGLVKYKEVVKNDRITINIEDLLKYDDLQFVDLIYKRLLNREPDEAGLVNNVNMLRQNKLNKVDIIKDFIRSEEYIKTKGNIKIKNLKSADILQKIQRKFTKIPFIGYIFNIIIEIIMLPKRSRQFEEFRRINSILINENKSDIMEVMEILKKHKNIIDGNIEITDNEIARLQEQLNQITKRCEYLAEDYKNNDKKIKGQLNEFRKETTFELERIREKLFQTIGKLSNTSLNACTKKEKTQLSSLIDLDQFYVNFEDKFRGDEELISKRLDIYINKLKRNFDSNYEIKLLDLGCGRGEWISKLIDNGFNNVIGVDLNSAMISECRRKGLNVLNGNAIDYLNIQPDNSVDFISGFQIIEHLSFEEKVQFVQQSYRVLKKNGVFLLETPNPENVFVGSCSFYLDFTHKNPVHPEALKFLIEEFGFKQAEIIRVNPLNYNDQSQITGEMSHIAFRFNMEQDYSVWGVK